MTTKTFPSIHGRCPACRGDSLFIGTGGWVTCSRLGCPDPSAADKLLHGEHVGAATPLICSDERHAAKVAALQAALARVRVIASELFMAGRTKTERDIARRLHTALDQPAPAATQATEPATCCVCGGGPVVYRNYREQPFCWPCADCQCNQTPCVRTGTNAPAAAAQPEPATVTDPEWLKQQYAAAINEGFRTFDADKTEDAYLSEHLATAVMRARDRHLAQLVQRLRLADQTCRQEQQRADQAEDLLSIAHDTSNKSEAERARAVQRADRLADTLRQALDGYWKTGCLNAAKHAEYAAVLDQHQEQPTTKPREHCGHISPDTGLTTPRTECVLQPGHSGSHADEVGCRWWPVTEEQPGA